MVTTENWEGLWGWELRLTDSTNAIIQPALTLSKDLNTKQSSTRILDESKLHFFLLDHEKWFSKVSISSRNTRITICNLILFSKYENGLMIISISSRQARARKIILNLISKDCIFSREWKWDSKSKPITVLHRRKLYDMIFDKQGHEYSTSHQGGSRLVLWWSRGGWVDRTGVNCTAIAVWTLRQYILDAHKN